MRCDDLEKTTPGPVINRVVEADPRPSLAGGGSLASYALLERFT
jgi:hypothetical protein